MRAPATTRLSPSVEASYAHGLMPEPSNENRLRVLRETELLDSAQDAAFDRLTRLAAHLVGAPVALISLVDDRRQFFKSALGLREPWASKRETPLSHSFCQYAMRNRAPVVVSDARVDPVLRDNLAIRDLNVVAYAGVPLIVSNEAIGAFCVIDDKPRTWTDEELLILSDLAASVVSEIELRLALRRLRDRQALIEALVESIGDGIAAADANGTLILANRVGRRIFGYGDVDPVVEGKDLPHNVTGAFLARRADGSVLPSEEGALWRALRGEPTDGLEFSLEPRLLPGETRATEPRWIEATGRPVPGVDGRAIAGVAVYRDVTAQRAHREELRAARVALERHARALEEASVTDELTGLLNRRGFVLLAGQQMKLAVRANRALLLFFVDLNGMKSINDTLGHETGDRALVDTAAALRRTFRQSDVIARLGGDEFVVLAADAALTDGHALVKRLRELLAEHNTGAAPFRLSLSVGMALFDPRKPLTLEKLLAEADARMYADKEEHRNRPSGRRIRRP